MYKGLSIWSSLLLLGNFTFLDLGSPSFGDKNMKGFGMQHAGNRIQETFAK